MGDPPILAIFDEANAAQAADSVLLASISKGDRAALEELVLRHQAWIYNIALRMLGNAMDAEDATQEIFIKAITKLATFKGGSEFRTWLYRIAKNHLLSMARRPMEDYFPSFDRHAEVLRETPDSEPVDEKSPTPYHRLLVEETKRECMAGMLLCLDRTQRLVFILGGVFGINGNVGGEIMEMSPENFRQILSRSRMELSRYMNEECGLANPVNPCRCERKTRAMIELGYVDPERLRFDDGHIERVSSFVEANAAMADDALELRAQGLFRDSPFLKSRDFMAALVEKFGWEKFELGGW